MGLHFYSTLQHLSQSPMYADIHTVMAKSVMQGADLLIRSIRGSVSCSGIFRDAAGRKWNQQPSNYWTPRSTSELQPSKNAIGGLF